MISSERVARMLAWLLRNENTSPHEIMRAVNSAVDMQAGDSVTLYGDDEEHYRRAFVNEQTRLLEGVKS